jgi:cation:H+ antiporter
MFIAATTSLPELVVCVSALRLGAIDLAIGNVLGSNLFNVFILALDDLFYLPGPILASVSRSHLISILAALVMNALLLAGITYQSMRKRLALAADTWGIVAIYVGAMILLARHG